MDNVDFKELALQWRNHLGLTQEGMAEFCSVGFSTIQGWESGRSKIGKNSVQKISQKLGITPAEFMRGPEFMRKDNGGIERMALPEDLLLKLKEAARRLEFGEDFILRAVLEVFFLLDHDSQYAELRTYYELLGERFEERKKNPHSYCDPKTR